MRGYVTAILAALIPTAAQAQDAEIRQEVIARCRAAAGQHGSWLVKACVDQDIEAFKALAEYPESAARSSTGALTKRGSTDGGWSRHVPIKTSRHSRPSLSTLSLHARSSTGALTKRGSTDGGWSRRASIKTWKLNERSRSTSAPLSDSAAAGYAMHDRKRTISRLQALRFKQLIGTGRACHGHNRDAPGSAAAVFSVSLGLGRPRPRGNLRASIS
jgi:hypothetical protein